MKSKLFKRIAITTGATFAILCIILGVHIYIVTRPQPIDPKAIVMARIDMHEDISQIDADKIVAYMNTQACVNHTYVNPTSDIVVFTFFPAQAQGDDIVRKFKSDLHYEHAVRFMPTAAQLKGGCPAGYGSGGSLSSKFLSLFK